MIDLPAVDPPPVSPVFRTPRSRATATFQHVVLIEDNEDVATAYQALLHQLGHHAELARTGSAGVDLAIRTQPDAVLCDIGLPDIDGYEVARRLRRHQRTAHVTLLATSGYGQPADHQRSRRAGFDEHLVKPLSRDSLAQALATPNRKQNQAEPTGV